MADHQEEQACEANITAKQYLLDQLDKHIVTDPLEHILNMLKTKTYESHIHPQRTIYKHSKWNSYE